MSTVPAYKIKPNEYMSTESVKCALAENRLDLLGHWIAQERSAWRLGTHCGRDKITSNCILHPCLPWEQGSWGQHGADRTQVGPVLAPWTLLSWYSWHAEMFGGIFMCIWKCCLNNVSHLYEVSMFFWVNIFSSQFSTLGVCQNRLVDIITGFMSVSFFHLCQNDLDWRDRWHDLCACQE